MSDEKNDKWEMPKPVFRTTSGALPRTFEKTISQSFAPNRTNEIVEGDDILSLHDTPTTNKPEDYSPIYDDEAITETPDAKPDEAATENPNSVVVKAKEPSPRSQANPGASPSILLIFLLIVAATAIAVFYYYSTNSP